MRLRISHQTTYRYDAPVPYALQQLRLTPKSRAGQNVRRWDIRLEGGRAEAEFEDHNNNRVALVRLEDDLQEIVIHCEGEVDTVNNSGVIGTHGGYAPLWYFARDTELTKQGAGIRRLIRDLSQAKFDSDIPRLHALSERISDSVRYETSKTGPETSAEEALEAGHGVCQDHAHIFIAAARHMGIPARYVSGYLMMNDRVEQDASHAWAEVHLEDIGWIGFDVSNGISPDERYVRVATGLDYREAAPVSGMRFGDAGESLIVSLQVQQ